WPTISLLTPTATKDSSSSSSRIRNKDSRNTLRPALQPPHVSLRRLSIACFIGPAAALAILVGAALPAWSAAPVSGPSWSQLSPAQQTALAPLRNDWNQLDANRKQKWMEVASRFGSMSPPQQERVRERMTNWARMSPSERAEARLNYQRAKRLARDD